MTGDAYRDDDEKEVKTEKKDDKKKSVAFKATSSKGKAKQDASSEDDGCRGPNTGVPKEVELITIER